MSVLCAIAGTASAAAATMAISVLVIMSVLPVNGSYIEAENSEPLLDASQAVIAAAPSPTSIACRIDVHQAASGRNEAS
ncbi:hypothetical protein BF49_4598 [Bradyrhizobium sp.]|nr:hypothetical protein BF49_4598 [Bradyrhizobium sp.]